MIGGTDPQLTHMGNPWLFRFRPNDTYSARVIADYGVENTRQEEVGNRLLDRCFRHQRHEKSGRSP